MYYYLYGFKFIIIYFKNIYTIMIIAFIFINQKNNIIMRTNNKYKNETNN